MTGKASVPLSLEDFARAERRVNCEVCQLPDDVREQMVAARDKKISRRTILKWLSDQRGATVSDESLTAHNNGRHDA